jgi:dCTP deaminase
VLVRKGSRLNQLRIRHGSPSFSDTALRRLHEQAPLVAMDDDNSEPNIDDGLALSIDLKGNADTNSGSGGKRIGFRAKRHTGLIDVDKVGALDPADYWEPIEANSRGDMILDPNEFYILVSRERVAIPPDHAAEMVPFNPLVGEFRVHYAGFFDPGFGYEPGAAPSARGVLEVRSREVPFILEHGQIIGRLIFERLTDPPPEGYGETLGSNYQRQGLKLSKHFRT